MLRPLLLLALAASAPAQALIDWDFSGLVNPGVPDGPVTNPLISASDASLGTGLLTTDLVAVRGQAHYDGLLWASSTTHGELDLKWWDGDRADASTHHDGVSDNWIAFTLLNTQGSPQDVERISVRAWRNGAGAVGRYVFEVAVDGGPAQPYAAPQDDPVVGDGGYDWFHFDEALQFSSTLEVRFRPVALPGGQGTGNLHVKGLRVLASADGGGAPTGPNVLLIVADDLAPGALGCYGNDQVLTPNIDALADRGVVFDRAYCQYPVCDASRASFNTGLYPDRIQALGGGFWSFDAALGAHPTLPEHFKLSGYHSSRVSKIYHMRVPGDITSGSAGPDHGPSWTTTTNVQAPEWITPGPAAHYTNENLNFDPNQHYGLGFGTAFYTVEGTLPGDEQADWIAADAAIDRLEQLQDEPFFLALGFVRPHVPLVAPQGIYAQYDPNLMELADSVPNDLADIPGAGIFWDEPVRGPWSDDARRHVLRGYYASVTFLDQQVGRVLAKLDELDLEDDTIVIFTSDHGYHLGEHTFWQKLSLHEESARVPLIVSAPGVDAARTDALAELLDLYPTLADLTGLSTPAGAQGVNLRPVLEDPAADVRETVLCSIGGGDLLRTDTWAFMRYGNGSEELYDMRPAPAGDPLQFTNLANDPAYASVVADLRAQLTQRLVAAAGDAGDAVCFGDGSGGTCPCNQFGGPGEGCLTSSGTGATLSGGGMPSLTSDGFRLTISGGPPGMPGLLFQGLSPMEAPFGDGILCTNPVLRHPVHALDAAGSAEYEGLASTGIQGTTLFYQYWFRDPAGPCAGSFNLTNAWQVI